MTLFTEVIIYQHFQQVSWLLLAFVRLQTLVQFFLCFSAFCQFPCHFYENSFVLTFIMGIFYFILRFGLVGVKIHKINYFFSAHLQQFCNTK